MLAIKGASGIGATRTATAWSAGAATIPSGDTGTPGPYAWKNVAIKGGGFVSGIVMSRALPGLMFARTDVGVGWGAIDLQ